MLYNRSGDGVNDLACDCRTYGTSRDRDFTFERAIAEDILITVRPRGGSSWALRDPGKEWAPALPEQEAQLVGHEIYDLTMGRVTESVASIIIDA